MQLKAPKFPYIANVNGRAVRSASAVATDLADNIAHGVRWHDATIVAEELGCNLFLEMPPGHTLTDLAARKRSRCYRFCRHIGSFQTRFATRRRLRSDV